MGAIVKVTAIVFLFFVLTGFNLDSSIPGFTFGPGAMEVTETTAKVWLRADEPRKLWVEYSENPDFSNAKLTPPVEAMAEADLTTAHQLAGLTPDTEYFYRGITSAGSSPKTPMRGETGRFKTAPTRPQTFRFAVSGDMKAEFQPFTLFDRIGEKKPDFFVILGDTMYADRPQAEFNGSLDQYRAKHKENRRDLHLHNFLKSVPIYAIWDDHEVEDNFNRSFGEKIELGRKAFREYWPVTSDEEKVLYRKFSWTPLADFFILDTRQFRTSENEFNGPKPGVTMLGAQQLSWFKRALSESKAPFKFVLTSVPFNSKLGADKWAGYTSERSAIRKLIGENDIKGVLFISADLHVAADNTQVFRREYKEYIVGPIATQLVCQGEKLYKRRNRFYMCDRYNYLLFELTMNDGVASAEVQFLDVENKVRFRDKFNATSF